MVCAMCAGLGGIGPGSRNNALSPAGLALQALCEATGKNEASIKKAYESNGDLGVVAVGECHAIVFGGWNQ
jgi:hypothetical protein